MTIATTEKTSVVGIRFQKLGKLYHFRVGRHRDIDPGDYVLVETQRGRQLGQVISYIDTARAHRKKGMRVVERKATPRDLALKQMWASRELGALITCREMAAEMGLDEAKFVKAEYNYDGSWLTIHYSTENKNLNTRALQKALGKRLGTRVEMRLIGPRDVAKIMGGYGACGVPRCCSTFLTEFSPISIRMAKAQGISLSPQEITGMCGRLRCCLIYEYEQYVAARKRLPKVGKRIGTPYGEGKVRDVRVLRESVIVEVEEEDGRTGRFEVFKHEIIPLAELQALQKKAEAGCAKHENGGCDCGARAANSE